MKAHIDRLGRPDAINWVTAVAALVLMLPATYISAGVDFTGREVEFTGIVVVRVAVMLVFFGLGKLALLRFAKNRPQPLITIASFAAAMIVATTVFDILLVATGFAEESFLARRLRTTLVGTSTVLILSSLLVTYARDFSRSNADLFSTLEDLQRAKIDASERIRARQAQLIDTIRESINAELAKFGGSSKASDSSVMQHLIDDVVRPLSYSLNRDFPADDSVSTGVSEVTIDWAAVVKFALRANPFRWIAFSISIVLISASFLILNFGLAGILGTMALLAISAVTFWAWGQVWLLVPDRVGVAPRAILFTLAHIPPSISSSWAVTSLTGFDLMDPLRLWSFVVISVLVSWTVTLVTATLKLLKDTNQELVEAVEELKRELIVINNSYRQLHKGISRLLHGPVQEAITSSMLKLASQAGSLDTSDYAGIIRERISQALELLNAPAIPDTDLAQVLADLEELWSGVVEITSSVSKEDLATISADRIAAYATAELVREACSNATRHAKANRIDISITVRAKQREIELVVENDGIPLKRNAQKGIGSQLFDEQTLSWSRRQVGPTLRVRAKLPLTSEPARAVSN